jgi:hypothetical protein
MLMEQVANRDRLRGWRGGVEERGEVVNRVHCLLGGAVSHGGMP